MISLRLKQNIGYEKWSKSEGMHSPRSTVLSSLTVFLWDNYAKNKAFQNKLTAILQLKTRITDMITGCKKELLNK